MPPDLKGTAVNEHPDDGLMRVELQRFHRISVKHGGEVLFSPTTLRLWTIGEPLSSVISAFLSGATFGDVALRLNVSAESLRDIVRRVSEHIAGDSEDSCASAKEVPSSPLTRLIIYTTTACNLRCTYCYVRREPRFMTLETAHKVVVKSLAGFPRIRAVQFFGGEPTMNMPALAQLCAEFTEACQMAGTSRPILGLVTNLTLLDEPLMALIRDYTMRVTVSIDGPKDIHNHSRRFRSGRNTFDIVTSNLRRLRQHTDAEITIQATYTRKHWDAGLRLTDLEEYLAQTFHTNSLVVQPADLSQGGALSNQSGIIDPAPTDALAEMICEQSRLAVASYATTDPRMGNPLIPRVIAKLIIRGACSPLFCGAGFSTLAIYPGGELYPCNRLAGLPELKMGTIDDLTPFQTECFRSMQQRLAEVNKGRFEKCRCCWARRLCRQCIAKTFYDTGTLGPPTDSACQLATRNLETILQETCAASTDEDKWARITQLVSTPAENR